MLQRLLHLWRDEMAASFSMWVLKRMHTQAGASIRKPAPCLYKWEFLTALVFQSLLASALYLPYEAHSGAVLPPFHESFLLC